MQNVGSIVVLILVGMGSGITASIPVQNDEPFSIPFLVKGHLQISVVKGGSVA